jgi:hypothetical protein
MLRFTPMPTSAAKAGAVMSPAVRIQMPFMRVVLFIITSVLFTLPPGGDVPVDTAPENKKAGAAYRGDISATRLSR